MTTIELKLIVNADVEKCFDISRRIDIHIDSMTNHREILISGRKEGLCELGDKLTWEANHLGIRQRLSVEVSKMKRPFFFEIKMEKGAFKSMRHEHIFEGNSETSTIIDIIHYEVPFGILGKLFDLIFLRGYMKRLIIGRNLYIKNALEK